MAHVGSEISERPAIGSAIDPETKSYDRIYGMLLGVRVHVSRLAAQPLAPLDEKKHYDEVEKMEIPREGNHYAPAHQGRYDYKFKTYSPVVFAYLRHFFGISDEEYLVSLTADYMMSELKTIGRSSAMFYYTWDGRYVLKTLTKNEMNVLRKMLHLYYPYVSTHPDTLVNQFFGAYRSQTSLGKPIRFVIMNNVFPIGFQIHYKFDLKGSVVNRSVDEEKRKKPGSTWKEAEFEMKRYLKIGPRDWMLLKSQFQDDTNFLANAGVMDYSLLVGIHQFNPNSPIMHPPLGEKIEILSVFTPSKSSKARYDGNSIIVRKIQFKKGKTKGKKKASEKIEEVLDMNEKPRTNSQIMPYVPESQRLLSYCGGLRGSNEMNEPISEVYFMGIIDFLQEYNAGKKWEHAFKSVIYKKDQMSCISPKKYAQRMFNFLCRTIGPLEQPTAEMQQQLLRRTEFFMRQNVDPSQPNTAQPHQSKAITLTENTATGQRKKKVVLSDNYRKTQSESTLTKQHDSSDDDYHSDSSQPDQKDDTTTKSKKSVTEKSSSETESESEELKPVTKKRSSTYLSSKQSSKIIDAEPKKASKKSADESSDSDEPPKKQVERKSSSKSISKKSVKKESSSEDDTSSEEEKPIQKSSTASRKSKKQSSSDDEQPSRKSKSSKVDSYDDSSSDKRPLTKKSSKASIQKEDLRHQKDTKKSSTKKSRQESSDESDEEVPQKKTTRKKPLSSSDDEESSSQPKASSKAKPVSKAHQSSGSDSDSDSRPKKVTKSTSKSKVSSSSNDTTDSTS